MRFGTQPCNRRSQMVTILIRTASASLLMLNANWINPVIRRGKLTYLCSPENLIGDDGARELALEHGRMLETVA